MQMKPITRRFVSNLFTRNTGHAVLYSTRPRPVDSGAWLLWLPGDDTRGIMEESLALVHANLSYVDACVLIRANVFNISSNIFEAKEYGKVCSILD